MDKTTKIGENFSTHKPQPGVDYTPFLNGHHSPAVKLESCLNPL